MSTDDMKQREGEGLQEYINRLDQMHRPEGLHLQHIRTVRLRAARQRLKEEQQQRETMSSQPTQTIEQIEAARKQIQEEPSGQEEYLPALEEVKAAICCLTPAERQKLILWLEQSEEQAKVTVIKERNKG
jgi:hypothetical protein